MRHVNDEGERLCFGMCSPRLCKTRRVEGRRYLTITCQREIDQRNRELEKVALADLLTGLGNRRSILSVIDAKLNEQHRFEQPFGVLFADIDHFKRVNDTFGHDRGDEVLKLVAKYIQFNSRASDIAGRWGGEEFLLA